MQNVLVVLLAALSGYLAIKVHMLAPVALFGIIIVGRWALGSVFGLLIAFVAILFLRPGDFFPAVAVFRPAMLAGAGALGALVISKMIRRDMTWVKSRFNGWMILLTVTIVISSHFSMDRGHSQEELVDTWVKILVFWVLILNTVDSKKRAYQLQTALSLFIGFLGGYAIVNAIKGQFTGEGRAQFVGIMADPNDMAFTLLMATPFAIIAFLTFSGPRRILFGVVSFCATLGIVLTKSRGGFLGFGVIGYMLLRDRIKSRTVVFAIVGSLGVGAFLASNIGERAAFSERGYGEEGLEPSAQGRIDAWIAGYFMLRARPVRGVGFDVFADYYPHFAVNAVSYEPLTAHNTFIQVLAEIGIPGFVAFMALVVMSVRVNRRLRRKIPPNASKQERVFLKSQLPNLLGLLTAALFLSRAWNWFPWILFAQAATSERIWLSEEDSDSSSAE